MQDNHGKTEMKGTCHICGKNLASTHGYFIEAPIVVKQLQTFFKFSEVSLFEVICQKSLHLCNRFNKGVNRSTDRRI